jgi:ABC-2 type transport system permease protein
MTNKNSFIKVIQRECKRITSEGASLFVVFFGPLLAFFLISSIFYSSVPRKLPVAVVDLDHTSISRKTIEFTNATPIASVNTNYISLEEARNAMEEGKIDAVLFIPSGTEKNILKGTHSDVELYINNANVIKGSLLNSGIQKAIKTLSAGIKLQTHLQNGETEKQAMAQIIPIRLRSEILFNPFASYAYFITLILFPVMLTVFVLFGTLYAIGTELQYGTSLEWLQQSGNNIIIALVGKLLPYTIIFSLVAALMNIDLFIVLGLPLRGKVGIIVLSELLLILSYQSMAIVFITLTKNMRLAISLGSVYTMLALTYAGFTFPVFGMPQVAQVLNKIFPISYWMNVLSGQSLRAENVSNSFVMLLYLTGFIFLGCCFIPRLKYVLSDQNYWWKI